MQTNFARKVFASRVAVLTALVLAAVMTLALLRSAIVIIGAKNRTLNENIITNKQRIATLRNNIEKIAQFNNIVAEYSKIKHLPIDETVNLIKTRANLFQIKPTFKITKPTTIKESQTDKINFNFMSSTISLQYEAINDVMLFAFLDDIIGKINGGITIESLDITRSDKEKGQNDKKGIRAAAVVKWDLLNLAR